VLEIIDPNYLLIFQLVRVRIHSIMIHLLNNVMSAPIVVHQDRQWPFVLRSAPSQVSSTYMMIVNCNEAVMCFLAWAAKM
jgi:hypothetical protein